MVVTGGSTAANKLVQKTAALGFPRSAIRRGSFTSVRQLTAALGAFIDSWNDHPEPFAWTK